MEFVYGYAILGLATAIFFAVLIEDSIAGLVQKALLWPAAWILLGMEWRRRRRLRRAMNTIRGNW
jgi:ABC-type uncharacterized transport system permease subunit